MVDSQVCSLLGALHVQLSGLHLKTILGWIAVLHHRPGLSQVYTIMPSAPKYLITGNHGKL